MSDDVLITARDLSVHFPLRGFVLGERPVVRACEGINLEIRKGSFFGLVGESGSGKTTLGRALLKAAPISHGEVVYSDGEVTYDLGSLQGAELKDYRKRAQLIFQDPYAALSPRMTVRDIIAEPLQVMGITSSREETDDRVRGIAAKCRLNWSIYGVSRMRSPAASASVFRSPARWYRIRNLSSPTKALRRSTYRSRPTY